MVSFANEFDVSCSCPDQRPQQAVTAALQAVLFTKHVTCRQRASHLRNAHAHARAYKRWPLLLAFDIRTVHYYHVPGWNDAVLDSLPWNL